MAQNAKIIQLQELLAERFPQQELRTGNLWSSGSEPLDNLLGGGLQKSAITEFSSSRAGSALILHTLVLAAARTHEFLALVDGRDSFDIETPHPLLLWVRCTKAEEAVRAADLLLRDGNLPLVILDLRLNPLHELRKIPATTWYRLQRVVEPVNTAFLVLTPQPLVHAAQHRFTLRHEATLDALDELREMLLPDLQLQQLHSHQLHPARSA